MKNRPAHFISHINSQSRRTFAVFAQILKKFRRSITRKSKHLIYKRYKRRPMFPGQQTSDGLLVFDRRGREVGINANARQWLELQKGKISFQPLCQRYPPFRLVSPDSKQTQTEVTVSTHGVHSLFSVSKISLRPPRNKHALLIYLLRADTHRNAFKENPFQNMRHPLQTICCRCKKARTTEGTWTDIELFIKTLADIEFSHGLCPDCAQALYAESELDFNTPETADNSFAMGQTQAENPMRLVTAVRFNSALSQGYPDKHGARP